MCDLYVKVKTRSLGLQLRLTPTLAFTLFCKDLDPLLPPAAVAISIHTDYCE